MWVCSWGSCKSLISSCDFCTYSPYLLGRERHYLVKGCFCKTQAASPIPLMISMSIGKTNQKLLTWRHGNTAGLNTMKSARLSISLSSSSSFLLLVLHNDLFSVAQGPGLSGVGEKVRNNHWCWLNLIEFSSLFSWDPGGTMRQWGKITKIDIICIHGTLEKLCL